MNKKEFDENELLLISLALENEFDDADDEIKEMIKKLVKKVEMMLNDF